MPPKDPLSTPATTLPENFQFEDPNDPLSFSPLPNPFPTPMVSPHLQELRNRYRKRLTLISIDGPFNGFYITPMSGNGLKEVLAVLSSISERDDSPPGNNGSLNAEQENRQRQDEIITLINLGYSLIQQYVVDANGSRIFSGLPGLEFLQGEVSYTEISEIRDKIMAINGIGKDDTSNPDIAGIPGPKKN